MSLDHSTATFHERTGAPTVAYVYELDGYGRITSSAKTDA